VRYLGSQTKGQHQLTHNGSILSMKQLRDPKVGDFAIYVVIEGNERERVRSCREDLAKWLRQKLIVKRGNHVYAENR